jgi:hypothetical protein
MLNDKKFRAYRIFENGGGGMTLPFTLGNIQDKHEFEFEDGTYVDWDEMGLANPDTHLMEEIGQVDVTGAKIFDGDLIQDIRAKDDPWYAPIHEVVYTCASRFAMRAIDTEKYGSAEWTIDGTKVKIVGNKYENPELMK